MKLMLVDGTNVVVRATEAVRGVELSAAGVPTAAMLVCINILSRHVKRERPDSLVVCWDGGRSRIRTELYPQYKANRAERPADAPERPFSQVQEFLSLANIQHVRRDGWEADDLIARYCQLHRDSRSGGLADEIVIVSADHDLLQLVGPSVTQAKVVSSRAPDEPWDDERVRSALGCAPEHLPYSMALQGDPGDGVPGMRGIGPKKAVKLLAAANWDWPVLLGSLSPENRALVELSYQLVDLRDRPYEEMGLRVTPPAEFRPTLVGGTLYAPLLDFLSRYELLSVINRMMANTLWEPQAETAPHA